MTTASPTADERDAVVLAAMPGTARELAVLTGLSEWATRNSLVRLQAADKAYGYRHHGTGYYIWEAVKP